MYLKCESFQAVTGTTVDCWPLMTADIKANALILIGNTSCQVYIGGSVMTSGGGGGFPLPFIKGSSTDFSATPLLLKGEEFGGAGAQISLNTIYTRACVADVVIKGLYFRRVDEDDA